MREMENVGHERQQDGKMTGRVGIVCENIAGNMPFVGGSGILGYRLATQAR